MHFEFHSPSVTFANVPRSVDKFARLRSLISGTSHRCEHAFCSLASKTKVVPRFIDTWLVTSRMPFLQTPAPRSAINAIHKFAKLGCAAHTYCPINTVQN